MTAECINEYVFPIEHNITLNLLLTCTEAVYPGDDVTDGLQ
jgi:hypothetical protein